MTDHELLDALGAGELSLHCPCGVLRSMVPAFHKRTMTHDCVYHQRRACGWCRHVDRTLAGVEARLWVEAQHGPFVITKWELTQVVAGPGPTQ